MAVVEIATYEEVETKFDVGDKVEYLNYNTDEWELVTIDSVGAKDDLVVYGNDGGHWGYEDQYRSRPSAEAEDKYLAFKIRECQIVFGRLEAGCETCSFRDDPEMCAFDRYDVPENERKRWQ